jgi:ComF family protein
MVNFQIFTATCQACNKRISESQEIFCVECYGDLPISHFEFSRENAVKDKFKGILNIDYAGAWLYYNRNELVKQFLWEIKYNQNTDLAVELGKLAVKNIADKIIENIDIIIPIPLHANKLQLRGYNQTEIIGNGMSEVLNISQITDVLQRRKNTISQTKFNREERFSNIDDAFIIKNENMIKDKRILLIDDVMTTGATIEGAGKMLQEAGVKSLSVFTLATAFDL